MAVPNPKLQENCRNCRHHKYDETVGRGHCDINNAIIVCPQAQGGSSLCECYEHLKEEKFDPLEFKYPKKEDMKLKEEVEDKLHITCLDDFFVMKDGKIIANKSYKIPIPYGSKDRGYQIKEDNKLYTCFHCHTDDGFCSHGWWEEGEYVGEVEYTFNLQDVEDARFLEKMAFFFPNLEPQNVSATLKKVFEESRDEEVE